ncbi:pyridoxal-dependent decarboxylase [Cavenderia fasciculata]|uniref:Pyridoxal-dependent decarboxylase n=1 Tax=Cavenderia fasciculata TaxID=261658 RepID=F4PVA4_CACFS|nr:pyridoxal-dependent decarboxylase [Cavenderia fasciculata]EGG19918.1 pyridoxal-dependent decarboxylase [Cavenderia fasciculata]|eukprot:XP_004366901.1 pyridoxal-dependent decarboxylase [Cavenderia fasciculata]
MSIECCKYAGRFEQKERKEYKQLKEDLDNIGSILERAKELNQHFIETIGDRPVCAPYDKQQINTADDNHDSSSLSLSEEGIGATRALEYFWKRFGDGVSGSAGPRYLGFVVGGVTPASLVGDWTCSTIDQNAQLSGDTVSAAIEHLTIRQLLELLGLQDHRLQESDNESFTGSFVSGATMANFVGLAIARQWVGEKQSIDVAENGMDGVKIRLLTANAHSSSVKALIFKNQSPYLADPICRPDNYLHLTPENSRRFRALPLWMALKAYGRRGMVNIVERNVELAQSLGKWVSDSSSSNISSSSSPSQILFKLLSPVHLNVVCFALDGLGEHYDTKQLVHFRNRFLELLDRHGKVRCTPTMYNGQPGIRAAFVNWMTQSTDLSIAIESLKYCRLQLSKDQSQNQ